MPGAWTGRTGHTPAYNSPIAEGSGWTVDGFNAVRPPAGSPAPDRDGRGGGQGGGEAYRPTTAPGGGGSYCGVGGKGGSFDPAVPPRAAGAVYGSPELTPLLAGSGGGGTSGMYPSGGIGGPAIQLSAGASITVFSAGTINVGGKGGGGSGGGGSGGALLIEAPSVIVRGSLFANGGAGGLSFDNSSGQDGLYSDARAQGRAATAGQGSYGGDVNGTDGSISSMARETGGGGGGAGRIRINTSTGEADVAEAVVISPPLTSACATQGTL